MQKVLFILSLFISLVLLYSCTEKKSETAYFREADSLYNHEQFEQAINSFKKIIEYYPEGDITPKATFMIGYIYANHTKNLDEAKKYYQLFIDKYPNNDLADDAKYEIETLGQDINDLPIFKETEAKKQQVNKK